MEIYEQPIHVYAKINLFNEVTAIGSDIFITDLEDWILIDSGYGDKYAHAQTQYLEKPVKDRTGKYNYLYIDGRISDRRSL